MVKSVMTADDAGKGAACGCVGGFVAIYMILTYIGLDSNTAATLGVIGGIILAIMVMAGYWTN